ncbi:MAG: heparan-alpha-glucosaminide N-acetyltransferase domain-containing protein [Promethearchaeota archaeon]
MSSENIIEKETDPEDLISYLKEEIPLEDMRDYASPQRIESIDFVKGFAMIFIIICHSTLFWFDKDWIFLNGMVYSVLDILGPSLFVFLSALSVIFSIRRKKGKLPEKVIRARIFSRGISIMAIGVLFNIVGLSVVRPDIPFPMNLWGWNILMFIGFSQIASYYALKLKKLLRALIGVAIILISPSLRMYLYVEQNSSLLIFILHFIITSPTPELTLLPWLAICFISTIFGEILYETMIKGTEEAYWHLVQQFMLWGIILLVIGLITGWQLYTPKTLPESEYPHLRLYTIMNQQDYYKFPGMPAFLIRGTIGNMFYNMGAALIIIAICFYLIDIKKKDNQFTSMVIYYGKVSLSLFLIHFIFLPIFVGQFSIIYMPFIVVAYIGFLGFLMYIWNEYGNGFGSPEWFMIQIGRVGQKTGEKVKEEVVKTEEFITKEIKKTEVFITKEIKKTEDFITKETKKIKEKTKELRKKDQQQQNEG